MRGTGYAIAEIVWWMLAAAVVGGIIGWTLRFWVGGGRSRKEAEAKMEAQRGRYAEISTDLGEWKLKGESLVTDLESKTAEVAALTDQSAELERRLAATTADLAALQAAHAGCGVGVEGHVGQVAGLEAQLAERGAELSSLRAQVGLSPQAGKATSNLEATVAAVEGDVEGSGQLAMDAVGTLPVAAATTKFGTPGADHKDDLKVINGIGPKLERVLNEYGIGSWEQLAALSEPEVTVVDDALEEFPGRIRRDAWVEQARKLVTRFPNKSDRPDRDSFRNESPS